MAEMIHIPEVYEVCNNLCEGDGYSIESSNDGM